MNNTKGEGIDDALFAMTWKQPKSSTVRSWGRGRGRLNSIIGPDLSKHTRAPMYATTHRNKNVNVDNIKHIQKMYLLYWHFQQNQ